MSFSAAQLESFEHALGERNIQASEQFVHRWSPAIPSLGPQHENAALALDLLARWVDFDPSFLPLIQQAPDRFKPGDLARLSTSELAHFDTAKGLFHLFAEQNSRAVKCFERVVDMADRILHPDLMSIGRYYLARAFWRQADYERALEMAAQSKTTGNAREFPPRVAVIEMMEGWLHFLQGNSNLAQEYLNRADRVLSQTEDYINHGNALSFRGRLARRKGDYRQAIQFFEQSIEAFARRDGTHRNLARSHTNIAFVRRLQLVYLSEKRPDRGDRGAQARLAALCDRAAAEARRHLKLAEAIYNLNPDRHSHGLGNLHIIRALLDLDLGLIHEARKEACRAHDLGDRAEDHLVMANAGVLRAIIERRDGNAYDALFHADRAVRLAEMTTNRRARGRALIWKGIILAEDTFRDPFAAEECCRLASELLTDDNDYLAADLRRLKRELLNTRKPPAILRLELKGIPTDLGSPADPASWSIELRASDFVDPEGNSAVSRKRLEGTLTAVQKAIVLAVFELNGRVKSRVYKLLPRRMVDKYLPRKKA